MLKYILLIIIIGYLNVAFAEDKNVAAKDVIKYKECNSPGYELQKVKSENFTKRISMAEVLYQLLKIYNDNLTAFLDDEKKISEPDYIDQTLEYFESDSSEVICFIDEYKEGLSVHSFTLNSNNGAIIEGYVVVSKNRIKAVLYTSITMV